MQALSEITFQVSLGACKAELLKFGLREQGPLPNARSTTVVSGAQREVATGGRPALPQPCRTEFAPRASSPPESSTMRSIGTARPPEAHARYISSEDATRNAFTTSCSACGRWA